MTRSILYLLLGGALLFTLTGCSSVRILDFLTRPFGSEDVTGTPEGVRKAEERGAEPVGTVRFSYDGFVLIYSPTKVAVEAGTALTTLGRHGKPSGVRLVMSEERKHSFYVADVISGEPKAGDIVVTQGGKAGSEGDYQVLP